MCVMHQMVSELNVGVPSKAETSAYFTSKTVYLCGLSISLSFFLISILIFLFLTPSFGLCLPRVLYLSLTRILSPLHCLSVSAAASLFDIRDQRVSCTNKGLLCVFVCVYWQLGPSVCLSASAVQTHAVT